MSTRAKKLFPYDVECKNQEGFKSIYNVFEQSNVRSDHLTTLVVIKSNRKNPLVIIEAEHFFELLEK